MNKALWTNAVNSIQEKRLEQKTKGKLSLDLPRTDIKLSHKTANLAITTPRRILRAPTTRVKPELTKSRQK